MPHSCALLCLPPYSDPTRLAHHQLDFALPFALFHLYLINIDTNKKVDKEHRFPGSAIKFYSEKWMRERV
jgi:hypothetical protein